MKGSNYNIYIKLENNPDFFFLVHGYTGALDLIAASVVKKITENQLDDIQEDTLQSLKNRGYITDKTEEEEADYVRALAGALRKKLLKKASASFIFIVSYDCNFRCTYCFENNYSNEGTAWSKNVFSKEMVDKAYQAMLEIEPERAKHIDSITLYGGEPLLAENHEIVKYIVEEGRKRNYVFRAITNGYDLDAYLDLLGPGKIDGLQITIDGLAENHNSRRIHYQHTNSFEKIVANIDAALKTGVGIDVRMNGDRTNFEDIEKLLLLFEEKKWFESQRFSFCPATTYRENSNIEEKEKSYTRTDFVKNLFALKESGMHLDNKIVDLSGIETYLYNTIENNRVFPLKSAFCGASQAMNLLDPNGNIYPCWEIIGSNSNVIATYHDGLEYTPENAKWRSRTVLNMGKCIKCKYALLCAGGCAGRLAGSGRDIHSPYCEDFNGLFSTVVNAYYNKQVKNKQ